MLTSSVWWWCVGDSAAWQALERRRKAQELREEIMARMSKYQTVNKTDDESEESIETGEEANVDVAEVMSG